MAYTIHGAFKTGVEKTDWCIKNTLKGSFQILHDTPARRSNYSSITGSDIFPLFFCATRWFEDKPVSDRLLKIWPNIVKLVNFWLTLPKSKQPKSKSFEAVKSAVEDNLTIVKLNVFSYFASLCQPFLKKYQTEKPMIPYMYPDLVQLLHNVLQIVVKQEIIDKCTSGQSLSKIDLDSDEDFKKDFYLGFAAESEIKDLKKKGRVKNTEIQNFQKNVRSCVVSTLKKMFERSPLGSVVIRNAIVFNPTYMQITKDSTLLKRLRELFQHFVSLKPLFAPTADNAFTQYVAFLM